MAWTEIFKKTDCKKPQDVSFRNMQVPVPRNVVANFQRDAGELKPPFAVYVEVDTHAQKARIEVKRLSVTLNTYEWKAASGEEADQKQLIAQVKERVIMLGQTNEKFRLALLECVKEIKEVTEHIKIFEDRLDYFSVNQEDGRGELSTIRKNLAVAVKKGDKLFDAHNTWYLAEGPRKGIAPILSKFGVKESALDNNTKQIFTKVLFNLTMVGNEVKKSMKWKSKPGLRPCWSASVTLNR